MQSSFRYANTIFINAKQTLFALFFFLVTSFGVKYLAISKKKSAKSWLCFITFPLSKDPISKANSFVWLKKKIASKFVICCFDTYSIDLRLTLAMGPFVDTACWWMWRAANLNATSYLSSGANRSCTTSLQHCTYKYSKATESCRSKS